ncbi:putative type I restriction enzymeP M protein [Salinivirga cyanobacteriivorans]|uniref:Putative type I restriction enzymeP M protein n=1 Tax=Salinivirga cyanobacteriivorans TaxID=1307839 RepID=A0A0S2HVJ7_9BACT|nr:N-6 DNA methylase [Salinivirga cyanobacteriivorans]ALO14072.1 putative type I restriction enzymeP M protein [Salinivirga cyanobacteriivorans]
MIETKVIISIPEGKLRDYIDGTIRVDTPEEYVRQTVEKRLINEHKYSKEQIKIEYGVQMGSGKKRADIVIFPKDSTAEEMKDQDNIWLVIECKKEAVKPTDKNNGVEQMKSYMAACGNCEWGMWTNGMHKEVWRRVRNEQGKYIYEEFNDIPSADGTTDEHERPNRNTLIKAYEDNLLFTFKTCHNIIYVNEGLQKQPAFFEFLKIIFCKIHDERNLLEPVEFFTTSKERNYKDGQASVYKRISKIFEDVKKRHGQIFDKSDEIKLAPRTVTYLVAELQKYALLTTNIDIKGKAYEEIVGANLRGDRGEFFTPRNVMKMAVAMINPKETERVLDSSCGTGGFVVTAMTAVIDSLRERMESQYGEEEGWNADVRKAFNDKISEIASENYFGFDINPDLVKATKMNMVMNNDGSGNILQLNSLLPPQEWEEETKKKLAKALGISASDIRNHKSLAHFDIIVTNPPFGSKIPIKDQQILEQFDIAYIWNKDENGNWFKTDRLQSSVPPEQLFIERIIQLLKEGGRTAIVLPDSILGAPGLEYIRHWLIKNTKIIASVDLHADAFQPRNGTQCSILFLQKKTKAEIADEEKSRQIIDYDIFMTMIDHIGHDKRGGKIFKRDEKGNIVMIEVEELVKEKDADGNLIARKEITQEKIVNDQTIHVADVFSKWKAKQGIAW